jgi:hypothetical protein
MMRALAPARCWLRREAAMDETPSAGRVGLLGAATSRRQWLRSASGLFVAASGLVVPAGRDEAAAGDQPQRRHHGRSGHIGLKDISFHVTNELNQTVELDFWGKMNGHWIAYPFGFPHAHSTETYSKENRDNAAIVPFYRYYIQANNPYFGAPWVTLAWGGVMGKEGWSGGTTVVSEKPLSENESTEMTIEGYRFTVQRIADDDDWKNFAVRIQSA